MIYTFLILHVAFYQENIGIFSSPDAATAVDRYNRYILHWQWFIQHASKNCKVLKNSSSRNKKNIYVPLTPRI